VLRHIIESSQMYMRERS